MQLDLLSHWQFHRWRTQQICTWVCGLDAETLQQHTGGTLGNVDMLFRHTQWAEEIWLLRVRGSDETPPLDTNLDIAQVAQKWLELNKSWETVVLEGKPETIVYHNTRGERFENSLVELVAHLVDHATYHCAQMITEVKAMGKPVVNVGYMHYCRAFKQK